MRLRSFLTALAAAAGAACSSGARLLGPPSGDLDGSWRDPIVVPSGASIGFSLVTAGGTVLGSGQVCGVGPWCNPGPVRITGRHVAGFGPFVLTITGSGGFVATYSGQFLDHDQIQGTWKEASDSGSVTMVRCQQAC